MAQIILVNEKMWSGLERAQPHKVRVKNNDTKLMIPTRNALFPK
jgi:hypothetical protein